MVLVGEKNGAKLGMKLNFVQKNVKNLGTLTNKQKLKN